jgi:hypothetical protein
LTFNSQSHSYAHGVKRVKHSLINPLTFEFHAYVISAGTSILQISKNYDQLKLRPNREINLHKLVLPTESNGAYTSQV